MLTARDALDDRVRGLDVGADDYLTKPFAFTELAVHVAFGGHPNAFFTGAGHGDGVALLLEAVPQDRAILVESSTTSTLISKSPQWYEARMRVE